MKKIVFVCLGNICRSPMAEFVMKDLTDEVYRNGPIQSSGFKENGAKAIC